MTKRLIIVIVAVVLVAVFIWQLMPARREAVFYPMGGIPFKIAAYNRSSFKFKTDTKKAEERVEDLEKVFNLYDAQSELSRINQASKKEPVKISADMNRVLAAAVNWWKQTAGAFDVTVEPIIKLWKEAAHRQRVPDGEQILEIQKDVGTDKIKLQDDGYLFFYRPGVKLNLGGIAKGDIIDQVAQLLKGRGVKRGVVDAGGDILAFGKGTFRFGLQDPTAKSGARLIGKIEVPAGAVVTSGNYERYLTIGGRKYSHIIDPRTGYPADNGLEAATVIGGTASQADALATGLMVLGRVRSVDYLEGNPQFLGILVEKIGGEYIVWVSRNLAPHLTLEEPWKSWVRTF